MKDIRKLHIDAMELVKKANEVMDIGDADAYLQYIESAFILEQEAAYEIMSHFEAEPTRSVLFRSAANLAFTCGKFKDAESLIFSALAGNPFKELRLELLNLQEKVNEQLYTEIVKTREEIKEDAYLNSLKPEAINFRVKSKNKKHSSAVLISVILDFLKRVQQTYFNYSEIAFHKIFTQDEIDNIPNLSSLFKKDTDLLAVDLKLRSFGVSLVSDTKLMNYGQIFSPKFVTLKQNLFTDFKNDVILPDYNNEKFKRIIAEKYSVEERRVIFSPILPFFADKNSYEVLLTDESFTKNIKEKVIVSPATILILTPPIERAAINPETVLTQKLTQTTGTKKKILSEQRLTYQEWEIDLTNIDFGDKTLIFINPYSIQLIFEVNKYTINDSFFDLYVTDTDIDRTSQKFEDAVILKYTYLLSRERDLNKDEKSILDWLIANTIRSW